MEKKSLPNSAYNVKQSALLNNFILLVKKGSEKSDSLTSSRKSSFSYPLLVFKDSALEIVVNASFVRMETNWNFYLLVVDVHLIGEIWVQNFVCMSNDKNWCNFFFCFLVRLWLFFVLPFESSGIVSFIALTPAKFQLQSQLRLFQTSVALPISMKIKFYEVSIKLRSKLPFFSCDDKTLWSIGTFPLKFPNTATKQRWYRKLFTWSTRNVWEITRYESKCLVCCILLDCFSSPYYHYSKFFSNFAFPKSLPQSWNFFHRQQLLKFEAQIFPTDQHTHVLQLELLFSTAGSFLFCQKLVQLSRILFHVVYQNLFSTESVLVLKQPSWNVFFRRNECWKTSWASKEVNSNRTIQSRFFQSSCV